MRSIAEAVRGIVDPRRVVAAPVLLSEEQANSKCDPVLVRYEGEVWALRLRHGDHLPFLAELPHARSVRRLPDYLVFSAPKPASARPGDDALQVLVCELKSSAEGAEASLPQVRLGRLLSEYLVSLAVHDTSPAKRPSVWCCGLIVSPSFPLSMVTKGRTRPGKVEPPSFHDPVAGMRVYTASSGGEIRLESLY